MGLAIWVRLGTSSAEFRTMAQFTTALWGKFGWTKILETMTCGKDPLSLISQDITNPPGDRSLWELGAANLELRP